MNRYEIAVLYHPDLEIDLEKASQKVTKIITGSGGKVSAEDNWGKRKLAYKIREHEHAVYVFYTAELPPEAVRKIEASLNITDEVIRFLITKVDLKAIAQAEAARAAKDKKAEARIKENSEPTTEENNEQ